MEFNLIPKPNVCIQVKLTTHCYKAVFMSQTLDPRYTSLYSGCYLDA